MRPAATGTSIDRHLFDRRLYLAAAIGFSLIVLAGFARTYYARGYFAAPPLPSLLVHLHGLLMTLWVILFVAQVRLISSNRVRVHQRLGYSAIALAGLIVITGIPTAARAAKYGTQSFPPEIPPLSFMIVPMFDLLVFVLLFAGAIYYRRKPAAHKTLMLLTAINFLPPALGRIQIAPLAALGPLWFFGFPSLVALSCVALEARRYSRINKVFLAGTAVLIASYVIRLSIMTSAGWMAFAGWITAFV
jgi:hypothetical protein